MWGLSTIQVIEVIAGSVVLFIALVAIVILLYRRCGPDCKHCRLKHPDTQILVIEGPEEVEESDPEDSA